MLLTLGGGIWAGHQTSALPVVATVTVAPNALPLFTDTAYGRVFIGSGVIAGNVLTAAQLTVLDTARGRIHHALALPAPPGRMPTNMVASTPPVAAVEDGGRAYILGQANGDVPSTIMALDARTGRLLASVALPPGPDAWLAVDAQTHRLFVLALQFPTVYVSVYDARTLRHLVDTTVDSPAFSGAPWSVVGVPIAVDARTKRVFVSFAASNSLGVLNARDGTLLATTALRPPSNATSGAVVINTPVVNERTGRVYVTDSASGTVNTLDAASGRLLRSIKLGPNASAPIVDERTGHIFVVHAGGLSMLDARSGRLLATIHLHVALASGGAAVDERTGYLYLSDAITGLLHIIDGTSGRLRESLQWARVPTAVVVDGPHRRAIIFTGHTRVTSDGWAWVPGWLRRRVPFLPAPGITVTSDPDRVTILDTARL